MKKFLGILALTNAILSPAAHAYGVMQTAHDKQGRAVELTDERCDAPDQYKARGITEKGVVLGGCWLALKPGEQYVTVHWANGATRAYPLGHFDISDYAVKKYGKDKPVQQ